MTPNLLSTFVLIVWPLAAGIFFATRNGRDALILTLLCAYLLLPHGTGFKFPMVPMLDKYSIPTLCAFVGCLIAYRTRPQQINRSIVVNLLIVIYIFSPVVTSLENGDAVVVGERIIDGVGLYDGLSAALSQFVVIVPFLLGRHIFRSGSDVEKIFHVLVKAGVLYSLALLFEIRFSPQLHYIVYGYFPTDFIQTVRDSGGYRPMGFLGHGLTAAFFAMTAAVAAAALSRTNKTVYGLPSSSVTGYLSLVLLLCKSAAATVYGMVLVPLVRWCSLKMQRRVALILVTIALLYPVLRLTNVFPDKELVEISQSVTERAWSLEFRFNQERDLLARASERSLFGWGRFGRSRVYAEDGGEISVTDGRWIITFGQFGAVGFLAEFGLLSLPIFLAFSALKRPLPTTEKIPISALALILAINMIELLPNSTLGPWSWMIAGALLGRSESLAFITRKNSGTTKLKLDPQHSQQFRNI